MSIYNTVAALPFAKHVFGRKMTNEDIETLAEYTVCRGLHPTIAKYKKNDVILEVIEDTIDSGRTFHDFENALNKAIDRHSTDNYPRTGPVDAELAFVPTTRWFFMCPRKPTAEDKGLCIFFGRPMHLPPGLVTWEQRVSACLTILNHEHQERERVAGIAAKVEEYRLKLEDETPHIKDNIDVSQSHVSNAITLKISSDYGKYLESNEWRNSLFQKIKKEGYDQPTYSSIIDRQPASLPYFTTSEPREVQIDIEGDFDVSLALVQAQAQVPVVPTVDVCAEYSPQPLSDIEFYDGLITEEGILLH